MVNAVKKGNRSQNKARKKLEAEGWLCYVARRGYKGQAIDIWGLWDIVAWRDGYIKLVQVKTNYCPPDQKEKMRNFCTDGLFVTKELWIYKDYDRKSPYIEEMRGE